MYILHRLLTFKELLLSYALVLFDLELRFEKFKRKLSDKFGLKNTDLREQAHYRLSCNRRGVEKGACVWLQCSRVECDGLCCNKWGWVRDKRELQENVLNTCIFRKTPACVTRYCDTFVGVIWKRSRSTDRREEISKSWSGAHGSIEAMSKSWIELAQNHETNPPIFASIECTRRLCVTNPQYPGEPEYAKQIGLGGLSRCPTQTHPIFILQ